MRALALVALAAAAFGQNRETARIPTRDGKQQPLILVAPGHSAGPVPLVVHLHSWSATFDKSSEFDVAVTETHRRGWALVSPDFRGPNQVPEACGSPLAVQDVLDAVAYARTRLNIDPKRIYLLGGSGGGYMTLLMAARAPKLWAAASAWVPITDLADWHAFSTKQGSRYAKMMEGCFGGPPEGAAAAYRSRSPLFALASTRRLPIDIQTGIRDGHSGSVPVRHTLRAFNALAPGPRRISESDIEFITREAEIPPHLAAERESEERKLPILFRRAAGNVRVTIFDGGHETDFAAGLRWLEGRRRR